MLQALLRKLGLKPKKTYECEWLVGHCDFMVPDPTAVSHPALRHFVKGKMTRVTVEIIGDVKRDIPANWINRGKPLPEAPSTEDLRKAESEKA